MTDREVLAGCARVRTKCAEKTSVGLWSQSRDPRELPGITGAGSGVAWVLHRSIARLSPDRDVEFMSKLVF